MTDDGRAGAETITSRIAGTLTSIFGEASPDTLFSGPSQVGDDLIITAASWERAGGFGFGIGEGQGEAGDRGSGEGGGGGGLSQGRPVAVIRVTPGGVQVTPVIDLTKIGVTLLLALFGVWRALKR